MGFVKEETFIRKTTRIGFSFAGSIEFLKWRPVIVKIINSSHPEIKAFQISVFEAISNALRYGQGGPEQAHVDIVIAKSEQRIYARIKSDNHGFNLQVEIAKLADKLLKTDYWRAMISAVGGRGLPLMVEGCQKVYFNRAGNDVLLVKNLGTCQELPLIEKIRVLNL